MKAICAAIALLASVSIAEARVNWQGTVMFTAVSPQCTSDGWAIGNNFLSTFLPSGLSNNGADTSIAFLQQRNAYSFRLVGRPTAAKAYVGVGINSAGGFYSTSGAFYNFVMQPAVITATTPSIYVTGTVTNFAGTTGCTATFSGAYVLRR